MQPTQAHNERMASMTLASVYPHYVAKVQRKGRSEDELLAIIEWLTGFDQRSIQAHIQNKSTFLEFFEEAQINPKASLIKGLICGYRVEEIENALTQKVRYLDKLVDELAKGKSMEKILRS